MIVMAQDTEAGTWIPLDTVAPVYRQTGEARVERDRKAYVTHYATCPHASEFSRKNQPSPRLDRHFSEGKETPP